KISLLESDLKEAQRKIDNLKSEKSTLEQQIAAGGERVTALELELAAARDELAEQEAARSDAEKDEKGARSQEEKSTEELNELRLSIATARQRLENLEAQRQPMAARDAELVEAMAARKADIDSYQSKLEAQAEQNRDAEIALKQQAAHAVEAQAPANDI